MSTTVSLSDEDWAFILVALDGSAEAQLALGWEETAREMREVARRLRDSLTYARQQAD